MKEILLFISCFMRRYLSGENSITGSENQQIILGAGDRMTENYKSLQDICGNINAEEDKRMGKVEGGVRRRKNRHVGQVKSVAAFSAGPEMFDVFSSEVESKER